MRYITEPSRQTPVNAHYDVIVVGGGFAGISAALAAAREGASVCLIEREWTLGGLGTLGLVTIYLPLCDGCGHQVIAGIGEELFHLAIRHGMEESHVPPPLAWLGESSVEERTKVRFQAQYNPCLFAMEAEQLLLNAGVVLRYGTLLSDAVMEQDLISAVIAIDKGGRFAMTADAFVDATGDADLGHLCGAPTAEFGQGNVLAAWYYAQSKEGRRLNMLGFADIPDKYKTGAEDKPLTAKRYSGLDGAELSEMMQRSHQTVLQNVIARQQTDQSYNITSMATIPQIRMTRRLVGDVTLGDELPHAACEESIGMTGDWRRSGPVYELPYGILHSKARPNLLTAGRCISVTDDMWDITRVIPTCAVTGQAAGTAAAMMRGGAAVTIPVLQAALRAKGVLLHRDSMR